MYPPRRRSRTIAGRMTRAWTQQIQMNRPRAWQITYAARMPSVTRCSGRWAKYDRPMRRVVAGRDVFGWASDILEGLESLWTKPLHYSVRRWEDIAV